MEASNLIRGVQKNQDRVICAPEAIAYENGWIDKNKLLDAAELMRKNDYGKYLSKVANKPKKVLKLTNKEEK